MTLTEQTTRCHQVGRCCLFFQNAKSELFIQLYPTMGMQCWCFPNANEPMNQADSVIQNKRSAAYASLIYLPRSDHLTKDTCGLRKITDVDGTQIHIPRRVHTRMNGCKPKPSGSHNEDRVAQAKDSTSPAIRTSCHRTCVCARMNDCHHLRFPTDDLSFFGGRGYPIKAPQRNDLLPRHCQAQPRGSVAVPKDWVHFIHILQARINAPGSCGQASTLGL